MEVLYAPNGKEGYSIATAELPDIVLMDWDMPIQNGLETTRQLKEAEQTTDIPIIMATGVMTASDDLKQALEAGAVDYVRKPYNKLELVARIQAALRLSRSYQEVKEKNIEIEALVSQKDRELANMAMTTHEHNKFLDSLHIELKELANRPSAEGLNKVAKRIKRQTANEDSWNSFMLHFDSVHPDYFRTLRKVGLTVNELKIAAYLKIGMGNKEIASLTGVEPVTVKSNIYRLKKKIGLSPEEDLRDYLIRFK